MREGGKGGGKEGQGVYGLQGDRDGANGAASQHKVMGALMIYRSQATTCSQQGTRAVGQ